MRHTPAAVRFHGFALPTAIFVVVILAALGAFMVTISSSQQLGAAMDVQGAKAYQAARAGMEWGLYRVLRDANFANNTATTATNQLSAASNCTSTSAATPSSTSFALAAPSLQGYAVTVTCYAIHDNTNNGPWSYVIEATACNRGSCPGTPGAGYVERKLSVTI